MNGLYTSYLSFVSNSSKMFEVLPKLKNVVAIYVMRNRGNNQVAPSKELLALLKSGEITWEQYAMKYFALIDNPDAIQWMHDVAEESQKTNVVLVCYEKDGSHCHRSLLAYQIVFLYPFVDYRGELSEVGCKETPRNHE